jgi:predicted cobalt transporter CbtA
VNSNDSDHHNHDDKGWADRKGFRNAFFGLLVAACIAAALAGFVVAWRNPHPHFAMEEYGVFFAVYGFLAFAFIVLAGQHLRKLVGRKEDYYDERE